MDNSQKVDSIEPDSRPPQPIRDSLNRVYSPQRTDDLDDKRFSPWRFLFIIIGGIFLAEIVAMIILTKFTTLPYYLQTVMDAGIMVVMIFPLVYFFSLKPLLIHIEKRKQTEAALRKSEERFTKAFNLSPIALSITRAVDGGFIAVNESFLRLYGSNREAVIGRTSIELGMYVNPEKRDELSQQTLRQQLLANEGIRDYELAARTRSDENRTVLISTEGIDLDGEACIISNISDITERKRAETHLRRINRALSVLNGCNQILVRAENEGELIQQMCQVIVNTGEYKMAWVGVAEQDSTRSVRPVAQSGFEDGYLGLAQITWADDERGHGPTGTAIREGNVQVNQNFLTNPKMEPWRASALSRGYQSSIALPLKNEGATFGALTIYSVTPDAFDEDEVNLLTELADDLAFGIGALQVRAERNQAQEQIREMALFPTLNPDAVMRVDANGRIEKINPAANQMGFYVNAQLAEIVPDLQGFDLPACIAAGTTGQIQLEAHLGERILLWSVRGVPELGLAFLYGKDITERKRAEAVVRQLSSIVEQTEDTVAVTDRNGVIEYVNPAFERLTGYTRAEALGKTPKLLKSGIHTDQFYQGLWKTILNGNVFQAEIANCKKNGELFYEVKTISPLRDLQGEITHFVATGKDITEHKHDEEKLRKAYDELELRVEERTEELKVAISILEEEITERKKAVEALRISETRFRLSLKNAPVSVAAQDRDLHFLWAYNQRTVDPGSVIGKTDFDVFPAEDAARLVALKRQVLETGKELREKLWITSGGQRVYLDLYIEPNRDETGQVTGIGIATVDLTSVKLAEETLRQLEERFSKVFQASPVATNLFRLSDGCSINVNDTFVSLTGYALEEIVGHTAAELNLFISTEKRNLLMKTLKENGSFRNDETQIRQKSGAIRDVLISMVLTEINSEAMAIVLAVDITERKRAEEELRAANEELARFNQAMVGRELRMIELKKEVNALCEQAGQPPRYSLDFEKEAQ